MRRFILLLCTILALSAGIPLRGQEKSTKQKSSSDQEQYERLVELQEVPVTARRPLSDVGTTMTTLDTLTLRETVVNSMADVLAQNTPIFIKSYGRGSLATASFRGTAPSHTQVLWNGMKLNSPTLGMVDFSMIPSLFIDKGSLYHGASSVGVVGGGLGGAVALDTKYTPGLDGVKLNFIQGISSFSTYDEFLRVQYGSDKFQSSTRFYYANAKNDFPYVNFNKRNDDGSYPVEHNKNGSYRDLHLLQEVYWKGQNNNHFGFTGWFLDSKRGVPMLNVNYREEDESKNEQDDSILIKTTFFNLKLTRGGGLVNFKIEWDNTLKNHLWQVKFSLAEPVKYTFSEDLNEIIKREFDPDYDIRKHLPKTRGIEAKTNFAPMQRYVGVHGFGIITKGLTEYEVKENSILITLLRSTGIISNPKNSSRSTPAGPPLEVPGAQQIGYNCAEFSIGFFVPEDYQKYVDIVYPKIIQ